MERPKESFCRRSTAIKYRPHINILPDDVLGVELDTCHAGSFGAVIVCDICSLFTPCPSCMCLLCSNVNESQSDSGLQSEYQGSG